MGPKTLAGPLSAYTRPTCEISCMEDFSRLATDTGHRLVGLARWAHARSLILYHLPCPRLAHAQVRREVQIPQGSPSCRNGRIGPRNNGGVGRFWTAHEGSRPSDAVLSTQDRRRDHQAAAEGDELQALQARERQHRCLH